MRFPELRHLPVFVAMALMASGLYACSYSYDKQVEGEGAVSGPVGFEQVRAQVFDSACNRCHDKTPPQLLSYPAARAAREAIRNSVFVNKKMPKSGALTAKQTAILYSWLNAGAPEFPGAPAAPSTTSSTSGKKLLWQDLKLQVLDVSCNGCHAPRNKKGISDLTDLGTVRASIGTILYLSLIERKKPMPPAPAALTEEQKRILADWIIQGELDDEGKVPHADSKPATPEKPPEDPTIHYRLAPRPGAADGIRFEIGYFLGHHEGVAKKIAATIDAKNDRDFSLEKVHFNIPVDSLETGDTTRDCHVREALGLNYTKSQYPAEHVCDEQDAMREAEESPNITLELTGLPVVIPPNEPFVDLHAPARLQIHGVTREISLPLHLEFPNGSRQRIHATSSFPVKLEEYGIVVKPVFLGMSVHEQAMVKVDLVLVSDQAQAPGPFEKQDLSFALQPGPGGETGASFAIGYFAGDHHGTAGALDARLVMQLGENFSLKGGKFSVPVASLETGNKTRDCHLREALSLDYSHSRFPNEHVCDQDDQLPSSGGDSPAYPLVEIEITDYVVAGQKKSLAAGDSLDLDLKSRVKMHGITKENIPIRVRVTYADAQKGQVKVTGDFSLSLAAFNAVVKPIVGSFGTVADEARVSLDLLFAPLPGR